MFVFFFFHDNWRGWRSSRLISPNFVRTFTTRSLNSTHWLYAMRPAWLTIRLLKPFGGECCCGGGECDRKTHSWVTNWRRQGQGDFLTSSHLKKKTWNCIEIYSSGIQYAWRRVCHLFFCVFLFVVALWVCLSEKGCEGFVVVVVAVGFCVKANRDEKEKGFGMLNHMLHNGTHAYHVSQTHTQPESLLTSFLSAVVVVLLFFFFFFHLVSCSTPEDFHKNVEDKTDDVKRINNNNRRKKKETFSVFVLVALIEIYLQRKHHNNIRSQGPVTKCDYCYDVTDAE